MFAICLPPVPESQNFSDMAGIGSAKEDYFTLCAIITFAKVLLLNEMAVINLPKKVPNSYAETKDIR